MELSKGLLRRFVDIETLSSPPLAGVESKQRAFTNMFVQRLGKGSDIPIALAIGAVPIRSLSILALIVIAPWTYFAVAAGRGFQNSAANGGSEKTSGQTHGKSPRIVRSQTVG